MNGKQIRQKVLFNKERINQIYNPGIFVLQQEVADLMAEIDELQEQCQHEFKDGKCIYCDIEEDWVE